MDNYIVTLCKNQKEIVLTGVPAGKCVDLDEYMCRRIYPDDWQKFKTHFSPGIFDPEISTFLDAGYEIRIYRKKDK
ncbi:MAG: hypothetical protein ACI4OR_02040 [Alphaproteobacteria bacterium]